MEDRRACVEKGGRDARERGEMRQREGSQKTNLEAEVPFQSYSFSEMANLEILQKCDSLMDI